MDYRARGCGASRSSTSVPLFGEGMLIVHDQYHDGVSDWILWQRRGAGEEATIKLCLLIVLKRREA